MQEMKDKIKNLEIALEAHDSGNLLASKEKEIVDKDNEIARLEAKVDELNGEVETLKSEGESKTGQITQLESDAEALKGTYDKLYSEHNQTLSKLQTKEKLQSTFKEKIEELLTQK